MRYNELLKYDTLEKIGVYISFFLSICTILYWSFIYIVSLINYSRIKNVKSGIYNGFWIDPIKKEINCEVLRLKKTLGGIRVTPIYKHKAFHNYSVSLQPYALNKYIFGGEWLGQKNSIYKGFSLFIYKIEDNTFTGKWIGPKENGEINNGNWMMSYYTEAKNSYLKYRKYRKLYNIKEKILSHKSIISNIILKHEKFPEKMCSIENIQLNLNDDSFIPVIGKISIPLAEHVKTLLRESDSILDLGTGTGFYPIYLAKKTGCRAKGIDIDDKTITLARANALHNGVDNLTSFSTCNKSELFSSIKRGERFDYIIANLPFTRISKSYKSRNSSHYTSFSGSVELLEQLILGSQYHIKPNGKLIFCYGDSGYRDLLESIIKISSWNYLKIVKSIDQSDDTFYIMELEPSDKLRNYYQEIREFGIT